MTDDVTEVPSAAETHYVLGLLRIQAEVLRYAAEAERQVVTDNPDLPKSGPNSAKAILKEVAMDQAAADACTRIVAWLLAHGPTDPPARPDDNLVTAAGRTMLRGRYGAKKAAGTRPAAG